ncbi:MAG TPA: large conductance mechanosensitive channel protein MscL [Chthonomonadaceae bacterium]|nr:large conductance mechanosensitive channel protein MscL [Chthonomonadaceae bacterium]
MLQEFKAFLTKSNALALAIGVIIGAATGKVVTGIVEDLLMPVIGIIMPAGDWREAKMVLKTTTDAQGKVTESAIQYGHFVGTVIDFLIIAFVVYLITKALLKPVPEPPAPPTKACPECLETIPAAARKCKACGSVVADMAAADEQAVVSATP